MSAKSKAPDFYRTVETEVRKAVLCETNYKNCELVWEYVDADVFRAINPTDRCYDLFYELFNEAAEAVEKEFGLF